MAQAKPEEKKGDSYGWKEMHADFQAGKYAGVYGGANSAWHGLAELRAGVNMFDFHKKRSPDEFYIQALDEHFKNEKTRKRWNDIVCFDPMGMYGAPPTISAVYSSIMIPELRFEKDDRGIVNDDGSATVLKIAIDYVWDIPRLAERLKFKPEEMRKALFKYTQNPQILDESKRVFLPPLGGATAYVFGDVRKLSDPTTEVAVRVHDSCCGSDVFGTDICTCRPYLVFAIKGVVECAQRGGVGIIFYFQKEGRSLGEVTKFRVYNARKAQAGGDTAEKYFYQTESIAGIRDARFQELMPDCMHLLGIERIDWLLSMSSDKYDGITGGGIQVMQRVALPDMYVPRGAQVEISAKISAGYHSDAPGDNKEAARSLRDLELIRERCNKILNIGKQGKLRHFKLNLDKMEDVAKIVTDVTNKNYPNGVVPYHSRWRHFAGDSVKNMTAAWACDPVEKARRLLDLVTISVLLDAGAGPQYHFLDSEGNTYTRSEGLAMASLDMFKEGLFSSDVALPCRVNSHGLRALTMHQFERGFQLSKNNQMVGAQGRYTLLQRLSATLEQHPEFFGRELFRPGNIVDYVLKNVDANKHINIRVLWRAVIEGFETIWPENLSGVRRGDVWVYNPLKVVGAVASDMVPFHKLSQWLTYSLLEPLEELGVVFDDLDALTGLAEYRNGGLFVDAGVLIPTNQFADKMQFDVGSELVVEWRACTLALLDELAVRIRKQLNKTSKELPLARILQGGTWAAGRAIAAQKRADGSPPLQVRSDGTVF